MINFEIKIEPTYMTPIDEAQKRYPPGTKIKEIPYDEGCSQRDITYTIPENPKFITGSGSFVYLQLPHQQIRIRNKDGKWTQIINPMVSLSIRDHDQLITIKRIAKEKNIPYNSINQTPSGIILENNVLSETFYGYSDAISFLDFVKKIMDCELIIKPGTVIEWNNQQYTLIRELKCHWHLLQDNTIRNSIITQNGMNLNVLKSWLGEFKIIK